MNGFRKNPTLNPSETYTFFNPKAGVNYMLHKEKNNKQRIYASIAIAHKEPNRDDFEASPISIPKPEQLTNIEAGYEITKKKWSILANLYLMNYKNQLVLNGQINDVGAYTRVNVDKSYRAGLELVGNIRARKWLNVSGNMTFSKNKIKSFKEFIDDYDNNNQLILNHNNTDIAFSPNFITAITLGFKPFQHFRYRTLRSLELNVLGKHVGHQFLDNTSDKARSIKQYSVIDFRTQYTWKIKENNELVFSLSIYNVLNKQYVNNGYNYSYISGGSINVSNYYYPQAGRYFLAGIGFKF
jgi:iron complex outermembrane receptor protein